MEPEEEMEMEIPEELCPSITLQPSSQYINTTPQKKPQSLKSSTLESQKKPTLKENVRPLQSSLRQYNIVGDSRQQKQYNTKAVQQFLEVQGTHARKRQNNLDKLKQSKEKAQAKEYMGRPSINSQSRRLTTHIVQSFQERLSKSKSKSRGREQFQNSFAPLTCDQSKRLFRVENVSQILHNEVERKRRGDEVLGHHKEQKQTPQPKINNNTVKLVARTIKLEFDQFSADIHEFTPVLALTVLGKLFNIDLSNKKEGTTNVMSARITKILYSKCKTVTTEKLWSLIQISLGIQQTQQSFKAEEVKNIKKELSSLYRHRMTKQKISGEKETHSFRPDILKKSERLASSKRQKLREQAERQGLVTPCVADGKKQNRIQTFDLYTAQSNRRHEQYRDRKKQEDQSQQMQECTFKPVQTSWKGYPKCQVPSTRSSLKRFQHLKASTNAQTTMSATKAQHSCYQPNQQPLRARSNSKEKMKQITEVKSLDATVLRMTAGRQRRELILQSQERGYPKKTGSRDRQWQNQKGSAERFCKNSKRNSYIEPVPPKILNQKYPSCKEYIFDVYVSTDVIQTVRMKSTDDPLAITQRLAHKHNLQESKQRKLLQMISLHLHAN